nr:hypothetical protein [Lactobacillus iners]
MIFFMRRAIFLHLETILKDYPRMDVYIAERQNNKFLHIADDKAICTMREQQAAIKQTLAKANHLEIKIIEQLYFYRNANKTLDGIALDMHISRNTIFYQRNKFLENLRRELGW